MSLLALLWAGAALGEPGAPESALTEAEFNAILNDFSDLERSLNLTTIEQELSHFDGFVNEPFWAEAVTVYAFVLASLELCRGHPAAKACFLDGPGLPSLAARSNLAEQCSASRYDFATPVVAGILP